MMTMGANGSVNTNVYIAYESLTYLILLDIFSNFCKYLQFTGWPQGRQPLLQSIEKCVYGRATLFSASILW